MQLRNFAFAAVLSTVGFMMAGCPEDAVTSTTCSTNADCVADSEVCNTAAGVCMQTCTEDSDCPGDTFACGAMASTGGVRVCQCSNDAGCNADRETADLICNQENGACVQRCTENSCGTGLTCNVASGVCESNGQIGSACTGTAQSTCAYGNFCSANACAAVPAPTCQNFDPARGGRTPVWTVNSTGPIIYDVSKVSFGTDPITPKFCTETTVKVRVKAYINASSTNTFPTTKDGLDELLYVDVDGQSVQGETLIRPSEYTVSANRKEAEFTMNFCRPTAASTISIGLLFNLGNEICAQISR